MSPIHWVHMGYLDEPDQYIVKVADYQGAPVTRTITIDACGCIQVSVGEWERPAGPMIRCEEHTADYADYRG